MSESAFQPAPCVDVRFTVEMETKASNARGHSFAHAKAIKLERDTVAIAFTRYLYRPMGVPGLLNPVHVWRIPRGTTRNAKALAKKTGKRLEVQERILRPACPLVVELTRISFGKLDDDNLRAALKAVRDQIAWELGINDRDPIVKWDYEHPGQEHGPRGYAAVRIRIRARELEARR